MNGETNFMEKLTQLKQTIEPYKAIIRFVLVLFLANVFWKLSIQGDENKFEEVFLWGNIDITGIFNIVTRNVADTVYYILHHILGMDVKRFDFFVFRFETGKAIGIMWGCSGIKQIFIFTMILLFSYGSWKNKLWFIPLGILICYLTNILRILMLSLISYAYPTQVELFHDYIFKYLFYGIIFLIWLVWNEKFGYEAKHT
jgi:exosortase/archaeosortase family protein